MEKHVLVKFLDCLEPEGKSRLLSLIKTICYSDGINFYEKLRLSGKGYSYLTDLDVKSGDIVLVDASGLPTLAQVSSISELPADCRKYKRVLAKVEFPNFKEGEIESKKNKILDELYRMIPKATLEEDIIHIAKEIDTDEMRKLLNEYYNLVKYKLQ